MDTDRLTAGTKRGEGAWKKNGVMETGKKGEGKKKGRKERGGEEVRK